MKRTNTTASRLIGLASAIALATPAWADPYPIADPGGPYGVLSTGSLSLDGSASLPSDTGTTIVTYEWASTATTTLPTPPGLLPRQSIMRP